MTSVNGWRFDGDQLAMLCQRHGISPAGITRAYQHHNEIVFVGEPAGEHNCDVMGCDGMHVVRRVRK